MVRCRQTSIYRKGIYRQIAVGGCVLEYKPGGPAGEFLWGRGFRSLFTTLVPGITVQVLDATPPTPVCDEITQVTLDPASCWARINAEDLDDGSHDNCCDQLYYAVALKDSVDYYEAQFQEFCHR
ncbi:MAG: hypothetical protein H6561_07325 [Lewinellaceae bacterium]|nr:hypothetical protein [Lewinellaceae bacterium]